VVYVKPDWLEENGQCHYAKRCVPRLWIFLALTLIALPVASSAQDQAIGKFEVSGGYTFLDGSSVIDGYGPGWLFGLSWHVNPKLAITMEGGSNSHRQALGLLHADADFHQLMVGSKVFLSTGRLRPFVQGLFGGSRIDLLVTSDFPFASTATFDETHPSFQVGGGIDIPLDDIADRRFVLRVAFDYRRVFAPEVFGQTRMLTGIAYGFGG